MVTINLVKGNIDDICQCFEDGLGGCWNDWLADHCCCCTECQFSCDFSCDFKSACCCNLNDPCVGECTCPTSEIQQVARIRTKTRTNTNTIKIKIVRQKTTPVANFISTKCVNCESEFTQSKFKVF